MFTGHTSPRRGQGHLHTIAEPSRQKPLWGYGGTRDAEGAKGAIPAGGAQAAGKGYSCPDSWRRLAEPEKRDERLLVVTSTLAPKSVPRLQGSRLVPTSGLGFKTDQRLKQPGHRGGLGAVQWEPQCWQCRGQLCLLADKDSLELLALALCLGVSQEGMWGLPVFHPAPNSLPSALWEGKG